MAATDDELYDEVEMNGPYAEGAAKELARRGLPVVRSNNKATAGGVMAIFLVGIFGALYMWVPVAMRPFVVIAPIAIFVMSSKNKACIILLALAVGYAWFEDYAVNHPAQPTAQPNVHRVARPTVHRAVHRAVRH